MEIAGFSLKNGGGFVCRIRVLYREEGTGRERVLESSDDILLGQERVLKLDETNVPNDAIVKLVADVALGTPNTAQQAFTFSATAKKIVRYVVTGTTLSNELGVVEVR